jgi:ABC-type sugar transport system ATPase subunit
MLDTAMTSIELRGVCKSFGDVEVIRNVSLSVNEGEFLVLVGPSGCGKSTLLRCIAGLEPITSGKLLLNGVDMTTSEPVSRGVAMVFQSYALYPHMTVEENIGFGMKIAGQSNAEIKARVFEIAKFLKLEGLLARKPKALSGGQRQRVAIGRALARKPKLFLFDKPLSNLDASLRGEMRVELAKLHNNLGNTMIYVTHDQVEAMTLGERMVVLNAGVIEQIGAPLDLFNRPINKFVAGFLGQPPMNFIPAIAARPDGDAMLVEVSGGTELRLPGYPNGLTDPTGLELGVRPEGISISGSSDGLLLNVDVVEQLGDETIVYGQLPSGLSLTARLDGQPRVKVNEQLRVNLALERILLFDRTGANVSMNHSSGKDERPAASS